MKSYHTYPIENEHQGLTVEDYLKQVQLYSGRKIQKLTRQKGILLNKKPVFLQKKVRAGEILSVLILEDSSSGVMPQAGPVDILWEDAQVIVVNKPPRLLVHPAGHTSQGTLANYLAHYFDERGERLTIRPLHRLDRDTSGCVVFAKDARTQSLLAEQLRQGTLKRIYLAIVNGNVQPAAGSIDLPIGEHPHRPNRRAVRAEGERAVTHYQVLQTTEEMSVLRLELETGKTHQIRVHLAQLGYPVLGDTMYGKRSPLISRQALHAQSVSFIHPQAGKQLTVEAPNPPDMAKIISRFTVPVPESGV